MYTREYVFIMTVQFVVPGEAEADSSPVHVSSIDSVQYPYWSNKTVDGNFSKKILSMFTYSCIPCHRGVATNWSTNRKKHQVCEILVQE